METPAEVIELESEEKTIDTLIKTLFPEHKSELNIKLWEEFINKYQKYIMDNDEKWNFNLKRDYFLFIKRIPRGKAKAPKAVQSLDEITTPSIERQLRTARHLIQEMETMNPKTNFIHPYIGKLNLKQAFTFIQIHTQHHLKIIDDILKK